MKPIFPLAPLIWAALTLGCVSLADLRAQEEDLERALKDQNRRIEGLAALASQIKSFVHQYLPESLVGSEKEEPTVPESSPKVAIREVKVADAPSNAPVDPDAVAAARPADPEREYRENLQEAATKLNITGSFPKRKQIMVGAKNLSVGDEIAIRFKENHYDLEILDITSSELKLRDRQSKLEVSVAIGMSLSLPPGMSRKPPPGTFTGGGQPNASPSSGEGPPEEAN